MYENRVMDALKTYPAIQFVHFPDFLDRYMQEAGSVPKEKRRDDFMFFKRYYFDHNHDPERLDAVLAWLDDEA